MENKQVTVEPVPHLNTQRDISSNHEEIQVSRRRKAQDTVQFQSADTYHDLENRLQNLEVVDHVEGETTENNHDQGEESQNLHAYENDVQEIGATGYSAFSGVQLEEPDDLQLPGMLTDQVFSDGMFNTCTIDTILSIMTILQLKIGPIHDFFKNSKHHIYKLNSHLPQLVREGRLPEMRSHIDFYKDPEKDYAEDINYLLQKQYVIKEDYYDYCASCYTSKSWTEVVNFKDFRPKDEDDGRNCIPDEMLKDPPKFFDEILRPYLLCFSLHKDSYYNHDIVAYCTNCMRKRRITCMVDDSDGNPAPLFIVMLPIKGSTKMGNVIVEKIVKDISPLCCYNYKYVVGAVIVFIDDPIGSETSSNCSDSQEEHKAGLIADTDEEPIGHYIGYVYIVNPESGKVTKKYRYCNSKGIKEVREFEEEGDCVTFLLFRIE